MEVTVRIFRDLRFSERSFFFIRVVKGFAADATDAPQPWVLLCNPMIKMIRFLRFSK
jgi:hypothetical protein